MVSIIYDKRNLTPEGSLRKLQEVLKKIKSTIIYFESGNRSDILKEGWCPDCNLNAGQILKFIKANRSAKILRVLVSFDRDDWKSLSGEPNINNSFRCEPWLVTGIPCAVLYKEGKIISRTDNPNFSGLEELWRIADKLR